MNVCFQRVLGMPFSIVYVPLRIGLFTQKQIEISEVVMIILKIFSVIGSAFAPCVTGCFYERAKR